MAERKRFGRPSDVAIVNTDITDVADSQSTPTNNPGFRQSTRIGTAKDRTVTAFIGEPPAGIGARAGVADAGNVYGSSTAEMAVRRYREG